MIQSRTTAHLSESTKDLLSTLLISKPLKKGDGDFEIGQEVLKEEIKTSIEAFTGVRL
jgi:hypothetical protein|tara:strand:- start:793 stop:966 length:174 start_codon:yes stop_codon:yes gene_type:complete